MKVLHRLVIACVALGCTAGARAAAVSEEKEPALYSFSDLYRLTVKEAPIAETHQTRVASVQGAAAPAASELRFTITQVPGPGRWPLLLAGLAAAAWVAHRRLTRPL